MPALKNPTLEQFAQAVFLRKGHYPAEAGKTVGYTPAVSRSMLSRPEVKARIEELKALSAERVINHVVASEQERKEALTRIIVHPIDAPVTAGQQIMAVAELNKMDGSYAPEKRMNFSEVRVKIVYDSPPAPPVPEIEAEIKEIEE